MGLTPFCPVPTVAPLLADGGVFGNRGPRVLWPDAEPASEGLGQAASQGFLLTRCPWSPAASPGPPGEPSSQTADSTGAACGRPESATIGIEIASETGVVAAS